MADWQKDIARLFHLVEQTFDSIKYRIGPLINQVDSIEIIPYLGFGSREFIYLKGRVLEDTGITLSKETDRIWHNLLNMYRRFESDEIPFARVHARFQDIEREVVADQEGFFDIDLHLGGSLTPDPGWQTIELKLLDPKISGGESVQKQGQVLIVSPEAEFGVISDIDDTVVHTGVTSRLNMARTILLKNARTRLPLKGVASFYQALQDGNLCRAINPLFYVSSSPWNMYDLFQEFFQIHDIPAGPVFLRDWGFERESLFAVKNHQYKMDAIQKILNSFPNLQFILIGDSGEEDPEIYLQVMQSFPQRILAAYIRSVKRDLHRHDEIHAISEQSYESGSAMILAENTQEMVDHAAKHGWISLSPASQPAE